MLDSWKVYFLKTVKGKRTGVFPTFLKGFLYPISKVFQFIVYVRNWAFDAGFFQQYYPPVPVVISIGNFVAGGTGKTPVTMMIAKEFYNQYPLAILCRGYKSKAEKLPVPVFLSKGKGPLHPASYCGDEPYLLSSNLPKAFVIVGRNRFKASNMAARAGAQLILLDDGMQHRNLARDFDVIVVNALDPFGKGHFLPRGFLRENIHSISRGDIVIVNHVHDLERYATIKEKLKQHTTAPIIATRMNIVNILELSGNIVSSIKDKKIGIFCGIAYPEHFQDMVKKLGADLVAHHYFLDHEFDLNTLHRFIDECVDKGVELVLCTEKDRVKLLDIAETKLPIAWLQIQLEVVEGKEEWDTFIAKTKVDLFRHL